VKWLIAILVSFVLFGCGSMTRTVTERDVSKAVGKLVMVEYVNTDGEEGYDRTDTLILVRMHRDWLWEPHFYLWGAVTCLAADAAGVQREIAMDRIGIPWLFNWGKDCAGGYTKRDATRNQARIEQTMFYQTPSNEAAGWPTHLYKR
jgi:hypothetical protein